MKFIYFDLCHIGRRLNVNDQVALLTSSFQAEGAFESKMVQRHAYTPQNQVLFTRPWGAEFEIKFDNLSLTQQEIEQILLKSGLNQQWKTVHYFRIEDGNKIYSFTNYSTPMRSYVQVQENNGKSTMASLGKKFPNKTKQLNGLGDILEEYRPQISSMFKLSVEDHIRTAQEKIDKLKSHEQKIVQIMDQQLTPASAPTTKSMWD